MMSHEFWRFLPPNVSTTITSLFSLEYENNQKMRRKEKDDLAEHEYMLSGDFLKPKEIGSQSNASYQSQKSPRVEYQRAAEPSKPCLNWKLKLKCEQLNIMTELRQWFGWGWELWFGISPESCHDCALLLQTSRSPELKIFDQLSTTISTFLKVQAWIEFWQLT